MKYFLVIFLVFTLFSCKEKKQISSNSEHKMVSTPTRLQAGAELDSAKIFGVYRITENDFAIVRNVQFDNPDLPLSLEFSEFLIKDSLPWINNKPMKDYEYVDSTRYHGLLRNGRFTREFLPKMKPEYFVYGKKGGAKCRIKDVVFQSTDCGNDFIAYILQVDVATTGTPLMASENEIPLDYNGDFKSESQQIRDAHKKDATESNYANGGRYQPKVFARMGDYYFTYHDDFQGFDSTSDKAQVQFPERLIVKKVASGKWDVFWWDEMDLLGLPCL